MITTNSKQITTDRKLMMDDRFVVQPCQQPSKTANRTYLLPSADVKIAECCTFITKHIICWQISVDIRVKTLYIGNLSIVKVGC